MATTPIEISPDRELVCVQGLGFVGAAMATAIADARDDEGAHPFSVVGVDLPTELGRERVARLESGAFPFTTSDDALARATRAARERGNLRATCDPGWFARARVVLVDVNLDVDVLADPPVVDFAPLRAAVRAIGERIAPGTLVIVETTVPPGTCAHVVAPELASALRSRGLGPDDFLLAHSYERVMPGDQYLASITNFWRAYAGHTVAAADACERFLGRVINVRKYPLTRLASMTASELAKALENAYRATNIAFVEEWARFAEAVGVDLFEVVDAIRVRPTHNNIRQPGFGVGGYCLTKDPALGRVAARQIFGRSDLSFPFSELALHTNRAMPLTSLDRVQELLGGTLQGKRVLLLGVAYRPDVADTRYSPAELFVREANRRGAEVIPHDPLVRRWPELGIDVAGELPSARGFDAVVIGVAHRVYCEMDFAAWLADARPVVLDANRVLDARRRQDVVRNGCRFAVIGEGDSCATA